MTLELIKNAEVGDILHFRLDYSEHTKIFSSKIMIINFCAGKRFNHCEKCHKTIYT